MKKCFSDVSYNVKGEHLDFGDCQVPKLKEEAQLEKKAALEIIKKKEATIKKLSERCNNQREALASFNRELEGSGNKRKVRELQKEIDRLQDDIKELRRKSYYDLGEEEIERWKDEAEQLQNDKDYYKHKCEEFEQRLQDAQNTLRLERYEHRDTKTLLDAALERETAGKIAHENTLEMLDMANETLAKIKDLADVQYRE